MKARILIIAGLLGIFSIHNSFSQMGLIWKKDNTDAKNFGINKGKAKDVTQDVFKADTLNGNIILGVREDDNYFVVYNYNGNILEKKYYNSNNKLTRTCNCIYNDSGNIIEQRDKYAKEVGTDSKRIYTYNEKNQLIEEIYTYNESRIHKKYRYKYSESGNIILVNEYSYTDSAGIFIPFLNKIITCKYDEKGNRIEENEHDCVENMDFSQFWKYNELGKLFEYEYLKDNNLKHKSIYNYNEKEHKYEVTKYDENGIFVNTTFYEYDTSRNIIVKNIKTLGQEKLKKHTYLYDFDDKENWIKKTEFLDNFPIKITIRTITYYSE
mgnify:CR=1 FL=1